MSTDLIEIKNDEINIYSIYDILKSSWRYILKISLLFLILGIIFAYFDKTKFSSSILISEITPEQAFYFKNNNKLSNSLGIYHDTWYSSAVKKFNENTILLKTAETKKNKYSNIYPMSVLRMYSLKPIINETNVKSTSAEISFSGNYEDYEIYKEILVATLSEINDEIKNEIRINTKSSMNMELKKAEADESEKNVKKKHQYDELYAMFLEERKIMSEKLAVEIMFLKEQAQIARNLNIDEPKTNDVYNINNIQGSIQSKIEKDELDFNDNYYNKGYLAIEEEIKALSKRIENENFFTNYKTKAELSLIEAMLESNPTIEIAKTRIKERKQFFDFSPISTNDEFRVFNYFTETIVVKNNRDSLIIISFLIFGFFTGLVISILESNYTKYKSINYS